MGYQDPRVFHFPNGVCKELVKKKAKETMGTCFKTFKGKLYREFILKNKEPDFDGGHYTKQKELWHDFKQYRLFDDYLELSRKNRVNSEKATNPHRLGSRGYTRKMPEFVAELEKCHTHF
jgi:hypothetical protein